MNKVNFGLLVVMSAMLMTSSVMGTHFRGSTLATKTYEVKKFLEKACDNSNDVTDNFDLLKVNLIDILAEAQNGDVDAGVASAASWIEGYCDTYLKPGGVINQPWFNGLAVVCNNDERAKITELFAETLMAQPWQQACNGNPATSDGQSQTTMQPYSWFAMGVLSTAAVGCVYYYIKNYLTKRKKKHPVKPQQSVLT